MQYLAKRSEIFISDITLYIRCNFCNIKNIHDGQKYNKTDNILDLILHPDIILYLYFVTAPLFSWFHATNSEIKFIVRSRRLYTRVCAFAEVNVLKWNTRIYPRIRKSSSYFFIQIPNVRCCKYFPGFDTPTNIRTITENY